MCSELTRSDLLRLMIQVQGARNTTSTPSRGNHSRGGQREWVLVHYGFHCLEQCAACPLHTRDNQEPNPASCQKTWLPSKSVCAHPAEPAHPHSRGDGLRYDRSLLHAYSAGN